MKGKRYFCDYWYGTGETNKIPIIIMILLFIVTVGVSIFINLSIYEDRINSNSEETYMYIDETANDTIKQGNEDSDLPDEGMKAKNIMRQKLIFVSIVIGSVFWLILMGIGIVVLGIIAHISKNNKNREQLS